MHRFTEKSCDLLLYKSPVHENLISQLSKLSFKIEINGALQEIKTHNQGGLIISARKWGKIDSC